MLETLSSFAGNFIIGTYTWSPKLVQTWLDALYLRSPLLQRVFRYHLHPEFANGGSIAELARRCGLRVETHEVFAPDGHVLTLHRISKEGGGPKNGSSSSSSSRRRSSPRETVLLLHGLMQDAESFLAGGKSSLAATLVLEKDCDVWLANARGSKYSQTSTVHPVSSPKFWDFCIDDLVCDVPLLVDFVMKRGALGLKGKIACVGFSQGSALLSSAISKFPRLNECISLFVCLAPAVKPAGLAPSTLVSIVQSRPWLVPFLFGSRSMLDSTFLWMRVLSAGGFAALSNGAMRFLFHWNLAQISLPRQARLFQHIYSPTSTRTIAHWFQIINQKRLCTFDGMAVYDLTLIRCPVAVFAGGSDRLIDPAALCSVAKNVVHYHCEPDYEHLDLLWADSAPERIFKPLMDLLCPPSGDK